ncbi:hypothetical protein ACL6C3_09880 [Capilliphycus salinus ALCB114379]|uniref:hypothetical protein n=1 Tax=Capilliphycus salinus TaxID=2768948 RepID=UPI0039A4F34A
MVQAIRPSNFIVDSQELKRGIQQIGLILSDPELDQLNQGHSISLEGVELGAVGSAFILASAIFARNFSKSKQPITFRDLRGKLPNGSGFSGIPIYCWAADVNLQKRCLCLSIKDGTPVIQISACFSGYNCQFF